ncbi:MAG: PorT family protein [Bacteroides sp.]|nr:PorT family protein [Bacteroides sp.]
MNKIILGFIASLFCWSGCHAADGINSILWGLRGAVDYNFPSKWHFDGGSVNMHTPGYGFTLGGVCNVYLGKGFYLEPGVSFFYDTYKYDFVVVDPGFYMVTNKPGINKLGLRVPVMAGYTFDISDAFSMCVYTGPEFSYSFSGKIKWSEDFEVYLSDNLFESEQRRADAAWKVGIGFPYKSLMASIDIALGMTDILKSDMRGYDRRFSVALTYYL